MSLEGDIRIIARMEINKEIVSFVEIATLIDALGGDIIAIDIITPGKKHEVRDLTIQMTDSAGVPKLEAGLRHKDGIKLYHLSDRTFLFHLGGKIEITPKFPVKNRDDLSTVYTPGVARICRAIAEDKKKAFTLTIKRNTVAVITDGTAVLGLGDIGPHAAMPVMEGKSMLFKQMANVDAFPICLDTKNVDEIVSVIKALAPAFGGINLEDIASPRCFEIEKRLDNELDIPVFHDDQHGTAIVILAGLINALKLVKKSLQEIKVVVCGVGAAGNATTEMLLAAGVRNIIGVDKEGIIHRGIQYDNSAWNEYASKTNVQQSTGGLRDALQEADVFIGLSRPGVLKKQDLVIMNPDPIVFAMANPTPEIMPDEVGDEVRVFATGRSDYPNQLNNVLAFPGVFRGALDCRAYTINNPMKLAAAHAIASVIQPSELNETYIIPSVFNELVVKNVRIAVIEEAIRSGVARKIPSDFRLTNIDKRSFENE